ncbi:MAG: S8 family serine peptidase [Deltaproteobacteria bacterium]|nr:S8 family serine peptidase [Deltaproteobacteria bacterium]
MNRHFLKRNAFVPIMAAVFAIYWPSVCVSQDIPSQAIQKVVESPKLLRPQEIVEPLEEGESTTRVIVTLKKPLSAKGVKNLKDLSVRRELAQTVGRVQARVLSKLDPDEVHITNRFTYIFGFSARVSLKGLQALIDNPDVASIEKDQILHAHLAQGIPLMDATTPRSSYNGSGVSVAICDTGIDYTHPKLGNGGFPNSKVIGGYDTGEEDTNPMDGNGHGTACAGIAAGDLGSTGDYIGGVAYNARLYALKMTYDPTVGRAYTSDMIEAWEWCITHQYDDPNNPIMVISTSFGGGRYFSSCDSASPPMTTAAANAVSAGMTLFVSSGNDGYCDSIGWPACISYVNSVGAVYDAHFTSSHIGWCVSYFSCASKIPTTGCETGYYSPEVPYQDEVIVYSNTANFLTLLAPSNWATTTKLGGGYYTTAYGFGGTSAACPYAAGAAACLQSASKTITGSFMTPAQVKSTLADTGDLITDGKISITKPRVNLEAAVESIDSNCPPCPPDGNITNATYLNGTTCTCENAVALTIGANVVIEAGATVTFTAPVVTFLPGSRVEEGATLNVGQ